MTIDNLGAKDDTFMPNAKKLLTPPVTKSPLILLFCITDSRVFFFHKKFIHLFFLL